LHHTAGICTLRHNSGGVGTVTVGAVAIGAVAIGAVTIGAVTVGAGNIRAVVGFNRNGN